MESKLLGLLKSLTSRVDRLEKVKPAIINGRNGKDGKDGKDGEAPSLDTIIDAVLQQLPEPEKIDTAALAQEVLAQVPKPRDGRDAPVVNVSDVAAIALANMPKPRDGKDGRDAPDLATIVKKVKAQVNDGERGPRGPAGPPGKDGVSITDVKLKDNDLFVFLDGKRKKAGRIELPPTPVPFSPGGGGRAGGSSAGVAFGFVPWYIASNESVTVPSFREMAVHGELVVEGDLILEQDSRLILEP